MDFYDKLLFIWDRIDLYPNDKKQRNFWIFILKKYLGVEYNV